MSNVAILADTDNRKWFPLSNIEMTRIDFSMRISQQTLNGYTVSNAMCGINYSIFIIYFYCVVIVAGVRVIVIVRRIHSFESLYPFMYFSTFTQSTVILTTHSQHVNLNSTSFCPYTMCHPITHCVCVWEEKHQHTHGSFICSSNASLVCHLYSYTKALSSRITIFTHRNNRN